MQNLELNTDSIKYSSTQKEYKKQETKERKIDIMIDDSIKTLDFQELINEICILYILKS